MFERAAALRILAAAILSLVIIVFIGTRAVAEAAPMLTLSSSSEELPIVSRIAIYRGSSPLQVRASGLIPGAQAQVLVSGTSTAACVVDQNGTCSVELTANTLTNIVSVVSVQIAGGSPAVSQSVLQLGSLRAEIGDSPSVNAIRLRLPGGLGHLLISSIQFDPNGTPVQAQIATDADAQALVIASATVNLVQPSIAMPQIRITLPPDMHGSVVASGTLTPRSLSISSASATAEIGGLTTSLSNFSASLSGAAPPAADKVLSVSFDASISNAPPGPRFSLIGTGIALTADAGHFMVRDADAGTWLLASGGTSIDLGPFSLSKVQIIPFTNEGHSLAGLKFSGNLGVTLINSDDTCKQAGVIEVHDLRLTKDGIVGDDGSVGSFFVLAPSGVRSLLAGVCTEFSNLAVRFKAPQGTSRGVRGLRGDIKVIVPPFLGKGQIVGKDIEIDENGILSANAGSWSGNIAFSFASPGDSLTIQAAANKSALRLTGQTRLPEMLGSKPLSVDVTASATTLDGTLSLDTADSTIPIKFAGQFDATLSNSKFQFVNNRAEVATNLITTIPFLTQGRLEVDNLRVALVDGQTFLDGTPQFKQLDTPWKVGLAGFGFTLVGPQGLNAASAQCGVNGWSIARLNPSDVNSPIAGIVLCGSLELPKVWATPGSESAGCIFIRDMFLVRGSGFRVRSSDTDGGGQCLNRFNLTEYLTMDLKDLDFSWKSGAASPSLSLKLAATQKIPFQGMQTVILKEAAVSLLADSGGIVASGDVTPTGLNPHFGTTANLNIYQGHFLYDSRTNSDYTKIRVTADGSAGLNVYHVNLGWYKNGVGGEIYLAKRPEVTAKPPIVLPGKTDWVGTLGTDVPALFGLLHMIHLRIGHITL